MADQQYIVSARKYRPATFRTVVGQTNLTQTLKNAIETGRLAHAYLFTGPRGVGKTTCARIFARTINCKNPTAEGEACGECDSCKAISEGSAYNTVELDAASNNSVDDIRNMIEQVNIPPQIGKYRVFIIDEVHMLSTAAFNAFLKTLEEPPSYAIFILATTEKHKVLPTILSRCQVYDFKRITVADMVEHLQYVASQEGITADPAALNVIAQKADGAMRDALSIFDQVAASSMGNITYESTIANLGVLNHEYYFRLLNCFMAGDVQQALLIYKDVRDAGFDSQFFINGLADHIRNLMVAADSRTLPLLEVGREVAARYSDQAKAVPVAWDYRAIAILNDCDLNYRTVTNKQLHVELALIRLCQLMQPQQQAIPPVRPQVAPIQSAPAQPASAPAPRQAAPATPAQTAPQPAAPQPAPQPAARPAQRPRVAPRQTTSVAPSMGRSFRISDSDTSAEPADEVHREQPYSPEDFLAAWQRYIETDTDNPLLTSAMQSRTPEKGEGDAWVVKVEHPAQRQAFLSDMAKLAKFLRDALSNDNVSLLIEDAPMAEHKPTLLTDQQFLKKIVTEKPYYADLLRAIDAQIV